MLFLLINTGLNTLYSLPSLHIRRNKRLLTTLNSPKSNRSSNRSFMGCNLLRSWRMAHVTENQARGARPSCVRVTGRRRALPALERRLVLTLLFTYKRININIINSKLPPMHLMGADSFDSARVTFCASDMLLRLLGENRFPLRHRHYVSLKKRINFIIITADIPDGNHQGKAGRHTLAHSPT